MATGSPLTRMLSAAAATAMFAAAAGAAQTKTWIESDGYLPGSTMPLELYGTPVGSERALRIKLPDTYDPATTPLVVLRLSVDDIDTPEEARMFVNGHGPVALPESVLGEGAEGHVGWIKLDPALLVPGDNQIAFVFADNLNGSTSGFTIREALLAIPRPDGETGSLPMIERHVYLDVPGMATLAVYDSTLEPQTLTMRRATPSGWKPHVVRRGNGNGGWTCQAAEFRFFHPAYGKNLMPFGLAVMDNHEIIFLVNWTNGSNKVLAAFSGDNGDTWSDWRNIRRGHGRPMMLAALGNGEVAFNTGRRYFSHDYGRTWTEHQPLPVSNCGRPINTEGNYLVDRDADGAATAIAAFGWMGPADYHYPTDPAIGGVHWSYDGGRTWTDEVCPAAWRWEDEFEGRTYQRGVSEGSLVRAANGWIVAALRTDLEARHMYAHNDNLEGIGVSVSKDNGSTWSPVRVVFPAGKMHPHLLALPDGTLVMTYIMRQHIEDGELVSYSRGAGAVVSCDNGVTWDTAHEFMLDRFELADGTSFTLPCGHLGSTLLDDGRILTCYGHYPSKGGCLIRWQP